MKPETAADPGVRRYRLPALELPALALGSADRTIRAFIPMAARAKRTGIDNQAVKAVVNVQCAGGTRQLASRWPFRGVPFLLKDLVCASGGDPIFNGMRLLRDACFVAPHDTYLAAKFRAAGFICLGKTNTPELGLNATTEPEAFGPSRNPWNPTRSTGGSSGVPPPR